MKTIANHRPGDIVRLVVGDLDAEGDGLATIPDPAAGQDAGGATLAGERGARFHVAGALPGEEISARIDAISSHRPEAWASLRTVHCAHRSRVQPTCAAHGRCGGCILQHCDVNAQVAWKQSWLRGLVEAAPSLAGTAVLPMVTSPSSLRYRNNSKLVAGRDDEGHILLGGYARRTHQVVDTAGCTITEPPLEAVAGSLRQLLNARGVEPYDEALLTGTVRHAVLRANAAGEVLLTLVTATEAFPAGPALATSLRAQHPNLVGVVQNVNLARGNAIYGTVQRTLLGEAAIQDELGGVRLRISSRAFFQANRQVASAAYAAIKRALALTGSETVVDAYAGVGGIALTLAPHAHTVVGIEEHAGAVSDAEFSAALNGVTNTSFVAGDVAAHLGAIGAADVVILNPPRKGCGPQVLRQVAMLRPRAIAYLSCAPETLIRDLTELANLEYGTREMIPFDMLPHTPHVEVLAILERHEH